MLAIWQTFAARIQNHPKVGGSLVLLETGSRKFHQVSPSLQGISAVPYAMIFREIYIYIYIRLPTRTRGGLTFTHVAI